ncbi:MAG TPA: hypothetical protein DFS52_27265, partial [Myxococcales bacterium]|nr:hypothetical protein [Myxococcales bacterium]
RGRHFEQALESFERARALAAEVAPARLAAAGLGIGRVHLEAGDPARAVEPLEAARRQGIEAGAAELAGIELALARALELSGASMAGAR